VAVAPTQRGGTLTLAPDKPPTNVRSALAGTVEESSQQGDVSIATLKEG